MSTKNRPTRKKPAPPAANGHANGEVFDRLPSAPKRPPSPSSDIPDPFRMAIRVMRAIGSIQMGVTLLLILVIAMILGTMFESWYTGKLARELIYNTWWFYILMAMLFLCILFAALKKFPWKPHQTGFLITHLGLLTLIIGGVVNSLMGVDSLMQLFTFEGVGNQASSKAFDPDRGTLDVKWDRHYKDKVRAFPFSPGSLTWRDEPSVGYVREVDPLLNTMDRIAHPIPKGWKQDLGYDATLEVLNYFTHTYREGYRKATFQDEEQAQDSSGGKLNSKVAPAINFEIASDRANWRFDSWVGGDSMQKARYPVGFGSQILGAVDLASSRKLTPPQIEEFLNPPDTDELGQMGVIAFIWDKQAYRFPVDEMIAGGSRPIGDSGWKVQFEMYYSSLDFDKEFNQVEQLRQAPVFPAVLMNLYPPGTRAEPIRAVVFGRGLTGSIESPDESKLPPQLQAWYHPPDPRLGSQARALAQFAFDETNRLFFRSYSSAERLTEENQATRGFGLEKSGRVDEDEIRIWGGMEGKLRVLKAIPKAVPTPLPVNESPGLQDPNLPASVLFRITLRNGESKEAWAFQGFGPTEVKIGDERFEVAFRHLVTELPYEVRLLRAEQTSDPGSSSAASYSSYVEVKETDTDKSVQHFITMNEPLKKDGFKVFQTGIDTTQYGFDPISGKPRASSTFTISSDPGLPLKYAGSIMLALGIATMFYMKAYFTRPRRRQ